MCFGRRICLLRPVQPERGRQAGTTHLPHNQSCAWAVSLLHVLVCSVWCRGIGTTEGCATWQQLQRQWRASSTGKGKTRNIIIIILLLLLCISLCFPSSLSMSTILRPQQGVQCMAKVTVLKTSPPSLIILPTVTLHSGTDWYTQTRSKWLSLTMVVTTTSIPVSGTLRQLEGNTGKYAGGE